MLLRKSSKFLEQMILISTILANHSFDPDDERTPRELQICGALDARTHLSGARVLGQVEIYLNLAHRLKDYGSNEF